MSSEQLRSLLQQARRQRRILENALTQADEDARDASKTGLASAALGEWRRLVEQILPLTTAPDISAELKAEIKEFGEANDQICTKESLLLKGQMAELKTMPKAAENTNEQ